MVRLSSTLPRCTWAATSFLTGSSKKAQLRGSRAAYSRYRTFTLRISTVISRPCSICWARPYPVILHTIGFLFSLTAKYGWVSKLLYYSPVHFARQMPPQTRQKPVCGGKIYKSDGVGLRSIVCVQRIHALQASIALFEEFRRNLREHRVG